MLARYLKAQTAVLLRGGAVGPIFLIAYFLLPSLFGSQFNPFGMDGASIIQQSTSWLLWAGLLITAADVLFALWLADNGAGFSAKSEALQQTGVLTLAQIRGLQESAIRVNASEHQAVVNVDLHIAGPGFEFDSRKRLNLDVAKQACVTRGKLVVLVDPNTHDFEINWQASGLINGVFPSQFTSVEDNQTYDLTGQAGPLMEILQLYRANGIPISGTVDLRAYPAVRQQVMTIVRRASQQPAAGGGVAAPPQQSTAERLDELQKLHASGAISDAEYAAGRQKIIADL